MNVGTIKTLAVLGGIGSGVGLSGSLGFYATESAYLEDHPSSDLAAVLQGTALSMILLAAGALLLSIGLYGVAGQMERVRKAEVWIAWAAPRAGLGSWGRAPLPRDSSTVIGVSPG